MNYLEDMFPLSLFCRLLLLLKLFLLGACLYCVIEDYLQF
jgi:hypothetical protein